MNFWGEGGGAELSLWAVTYNTCYGWIPVKGPWCYWWSDSSGVILLRKQQECYGWEAQWNRCLKPYWRFCEVQSLFTESFSCCNCFNRSKRTLVMYQMTSTGTWMLLSRSNYIKIVYMCRKKLCSACHKNGFIGKSEFLTRAQPDFSCTTLSE